MKTGTSPSRLFIPLSTSNIAIPLFPLLSAEEGELEPVASKAPKFLRMAAGLLGIALVILGVMVVFDGTDDPNYVSGIFNNVFFGGILLAVGSLLYGFQSHLKRMWIPVWAIGWRLALDAPLKILQYLSNRGNPNPGLIAAGLGSLEFSAVVLLKLGLGVGLIKLAKRASTPKTSSLAVDDPRDPVLYLRPFKMDRKASGVDTGNLQSLVFNTRTEEELMAQVLNRIGPPVAIGKPDDKLPQIGFHRIYISDAKWQDTVLEYMAKSRLLVLLPGAGGNFSWEFEQAVKKVKPERLLFLIPSGSADLAVFRELAARFFPQPLPPVPGDALFQAGSFRAVLYFEPDWEVRYARPERPGHFRRALVQTTPAALQMALRPVYLNLNLQWKQPPVVLSRIVYDCVAAGSVLVALRMAADYLGI